MSCLEVHISLATPPIEASVNEVSLRSNMLANIIPSTVIATVKDLTSHIEAKVSRLGGNLSFGAITVCGIDLDWEEFLVSDMVFIDKNGETIIIKKQ